MLYEPESCLKVCVFASLPDSVERDLITRRISEGGVFVPVKISLSYKHIFCLEHLGFWKLVERSICCI